MANLSLPEELPQWYTVDPEKQKGWTPKTSDIINKPENKEITNAWNGIIYPPSGQKPTVKIDGIKVMSPIQVGGGNFPEGGILPAQIGGVPYIPGSSIKGAFLHYLRINWTSISDDEKAFWLTLTSDNLESWQPRKIRFESILLKNLKPYPLNPQQPKQVFNEADNKLGIQWQVSPKPPSPSADKFALQVYLKNTPTSQEKKYLETRLKELLEIQGIGKGTASGFGRLASFYPTNYQWEIRLIGMKPCVQQHDNKKNQQGEYRWTPQVLRGHLRSYFTRLALNILNKDNALLLTERIFGGLGCQAALTLTSFLRQVERGNGGDGYTNIPAKDAHETWIIQVNCNSQFYDLINLLLELSSRLGGLGAGWRRPPHKLERFGGYRGSQFTVSCTQTQASLSNFTIDNLINHLEAIIEQLAKKYHLPILTKSPSINGRIISIWQGEKEQWRDIVHGVCRTNTTENPNPKRPYWCGSTNSASYYAVREHEDYCLITVFNRDVETTLETLNFSKIIQ